MSKEKIWARLRTIMTEEECGRIEIFETGYGIQMRVDIHYMTAREARRFLKNIVLLVRDRFEMIVVHGYTHGTVLMEMLSTEVISGRERAKIRPFMNPGITQIEFAAA